VSKLASSAVTRAAASDTPFPLLVVNPYGPNPLHSVEGFFEVGDRVALLHDVALTGSHLLDCVMAMRMAGLQANDIVALVAYDAPTTGLDALMNANGLRLHAATTYSSRDGEAPESCGLGENAVGRLVASGCILCDVLAGTDAVPFRRLFNRREAPSEVLEESATFVVIGDVAPVREGHVLIIPRSHVPALAKVSKEALAELDLLFARITAALAAAYRIPVIAFEHGMCEPDVDRSCGVDHAHLHVVPCDQPVAGRFRAEFDAVELGSLDDLSQVGNDGYEYLLMIDVDRRLYYASAFAPTRQYFRRVVAELSGEALWNWMDVVLLGDSGVAQERLRGLRGKFPNALLRNTEN
jgi:diadenosine tetraphosphate (Ap4A) HIT family hydrolase